jgi:hypothetical protein
MCSVYICMYVCVMHVRSACARARARVCVCVLVYVYVMYAYTYVCMYVCMYVLCVGYLTAVSVTGFIGCLNELKAWIYNYSIVVTCVIHETLKT